MNTIFKKYFVLPLLIFCLSAGLLSLEKVNAQCGGGNKAICKGDSVQLGPIATPSPGYTYTWSPSIGLSADNISNPKASPPSTQLYSVIVNPGGCQEQVLVTVDPKPSASFNVLNECFSDTVSFSNYSAISSGGLTYEWDFGDGKKSTLRSPVHVFTGPSTVSLTVRSTINSSCMAVSPAFIQPKEKPSADFTYTMPCGGVAFSDASTVISSLESISDWIWTFGDPGSGSEDTVQSDSGPTHLYVGTAPFKVTLTSITANGCKDTVSKIINPINFRVNAWKDTAICLGSSFQLNALATGGNLLLSGSAPTYSWSESPAAGSLPVTSNTSNPTVTPGLGLHIYTVTAGDGLCTTTDQVTVRVVSPPVVNAGPATIDICAGTSAVIGGSPTASSGAGIKSLIWTPATWLNNVLLSNPTTTTLSNATYTVTAIDNNGCTNSDNINIVVKPLPDATISQNVSIGCSGTPVTLSVNNSNYAVWKNATTGSTVSSVTPSSTVVISEALYKVYVTNPITSCIDSSEKYVDFISPPSTISIIAPDSNCINEAIKLIAVATGDSLKYTWASTGGGTFDSLNLHNDTTYYYPNPSDLLDPLGTILNTIDFTLTVSNSCDTLSTNEDVMLKSAPIGSYTYYPEEKFAFDTIYFTNTSDTSTYNIISWMWNFKDGNTDTSFNSFHAFQAPGIYNVDLKVKNNYSCYYIYSLPIEINRAQVIFIPNVFSPFATNIDNRECRVFALNVSSKDFLFKIYNRWGELVYATTDFSQANKVGWNGNNQNGEAQSTGVYTYSLRAKWMNGDPIEKTGTVTMIR